MSEENSIRPFGARLRNTVSPCVIVPFLLAAAALLPSSAAEVDFLRDVRPILSSHCFKCHGPDEGTRKGGLRLDIREEALKGGKSGEKTIVPGQPGQGELLKRIFTSDEDDLMPPPATKHPLSEAQKETLKKWIAAGAEYQPHWAFAKPQQRPLPGVSTQTWPRNGLDHFVLARLEKEKLQPSPRADKYSLVRRLYLDLIGLPPTPAQVDAFVNNSSSDAYEQLVDHLLGSPHYGERWARRWLDLARYADTNGYEKDRPRSMWPYRDWVINALNSDMPFNQFTIEQIAGDLLPNATQEQKIATGFHRNTMINEEGGIDPLEYRFYSMVDRVHVTATTWLGLTMACAQCHTHKYDPIQHTEYYQFMAFMNNADEPTMEVQKPEITTKRRELEEKIAVLETSLPDRFPPPLNLVWSTPGAVDFTSQNNAEGEVLLDGSIRVTGPNPEKETYTLVFKSPPQKVSHLQLEAIPDEKVGKGGPGRTDHGNFVLTEIEMELRPPGSTESTRLKFATADADFSQDGFPPENAFDGKANTGWAVAAADQKRLHRRVIFTLAEPAAISDGTEITVRLKQEYGSKHTLGRFRLSLGQDSTPAASLAESSKEHLQRKFGKWLEAELAKAVEWRPLRPASAHSEVPTLTVQDDHSIFASGDFTKSDVYNLTFKDLPAGVTAIRLEVMPDERLPRKGPGTVSYEGPEGDFFLSNVKATAGGKSLAFKSASQSFANGGNTAARAIDNDLQSGWSIDGGQGRAHNAVFELTEPTAAPGDLQLDLTCERYYAAGIGRFRIWVTTEQNTAPSALPQDAYAILQKYRGAGQINELLTSGSTAADRELLLREFAKVAPELASARREIDQLRAQLPKYPTSLVMRERVEGHPRATRLHHRGEWLQPKDEVQPALPAFLPPLPPGAPKNRLGFAQWLVSSDNPLTARVIVNRQWEAFFGRGLVRTLEDFGFQGDLPSHPDLLDWLALEFMNQGWSMKKLHKLIVMSATYQQSSAVSSELARRDPLNILLARGPRFRIESELVRDTALVVSGLFSDKMGGPSVFPPQPAGVTTEGAYGQLQWKVSEGPDRYRRGLYTYAKRTTPFAMTLTFDGPSGEACLARRDRSNTPLQALTLLNDEVFMECARALGTWAAAQQSPPDAVLEQIFRRCLTRPPTTSEREKLLHYFQTQLTRFESGELNASELLSKPEASPKAAAWTALARVLLNLDEAITRQ